MGAECPGGMGADCGDAFKEGLNGRPKAFNEEMVLNLFPDYKTEFDTAEIINMCRKKYNMSKSTCEGLIRQLKNGGILESQNGAYKRKFTANENV